MSRAKWSLCAVDKCVTTLFSGEGLELGWVRDCKGAGFRAIAMTRPGDNSSGLNIQTFPPHADTPRLAREWVEEQAAILATFADAKEGK